MHREDEKIDRRYSRLFPFSFFFPLVLGSESDPLLMHRLSVSGESFAASFQFLYDRSRKKERKINTAMQYFTSYQKKKKTIINSTFTSEQQDI